MGPVRLPGEGRVYISSRTPDAIHAATAMQAGCTCFLTNDDGFRQVAELPVMMLRDLSL